MFESDLHVTVKLLQEIMHYIVDGRWGVFEVLGRFSTSLLISHTSSGARNICKRINIFYQEIKDNNFITYIQYTIYTSKC